jgi:two-component system nitrate/nitrite sensor histidine kinase NarX
MAGYERRAEGRPTAADMRRLRLVGFGLPIAFLVAVEVFRAVFIETDPTHRAEHVALAVVVIVGIMAFGTLMFGLIHRAERQVIRQNRELTAINAVSTAVQGELGVDQIIDAALDVVLDRTGATEASVVVFSRDDNRESALERKVVRAPHAVPVSVGERMPHLVEIPLAHGTAIVGRLRLHLADDSLQPDLLASATLNNIGHQLACSIEIGQLIGDLQRREVEDRGLYDVLLRISNQKPLAETLEALGQHARDLLAAEYVGIELTPHSAALFESSGANIEASPLVRQPDGGARIAVGCNGATDGVREPTWKLSRVALESPELTLGEMTVALAGGRAPTDREWRFMHRSAELAVIAITSSRMREREREVAILAERERLAREMHDSLAQVLGYIHLQLVALRPKVGRAEPQAIAASLDDLTEVAQDAYRDVRESILGLRESSRTGRSLIENLRAYLERYEHQAGIDTVFVTDFDEVPQLSPQAEIHLIRVIQEALTNVRKHAAARHATVRASIDGGMAVFSVEDDGRGFDVASATFAGDRGFGLEAMRERMELVGGTLAIDSAPRKGTIITARVPMLPTAVPTEYELTNALV